MMEPAYAVKQGIGKGLAHIPAWLVDDIQAGLPLVKNRLKLMIEDVQQRVIDLDKYLSNEALIPDKERNMFVDPNQPIEQVCLRGEGYERVDA